MRPRSHVDALLIIDAQVGLLDGAGAVPSSSDLVSRLSTLLLEARAAGAVVVHLQNDGAAGASDEPGASGWHIHPRLVPCTDETLIRKNHDDGFDGTDLDAVLASSGIRRVAIAGLLSEMCVSATARSALARGFEVVLVSDAHGTFDLGEIPHRVVSRVAEHALGDQLILHATSEIAFTASAADGPQGQG